MVQPVEEQPVRGGWPSRLLGPFLFIRLCFDQENKGINKQEQQRVLLTHGTVRVVNTIDNIIQLLAIHIVIGGRKILHPEEISSII